MTNDTLAKLMEQAQVFASAWSLVGGRFDSGNGLADAEAAKAELREMIHTALTAQALPAAEPVALTTWARSPELVEPGNDWQQGYEHARAWVHVQLSAQQAQFTGIAARKLADLQGQGYLINGYSLIHKETLARGFIDSYGFVGWWSNRDHEQAVQAPAGWVPDGWLIRRDDDGWVYFGRPDGFMKALTPKESLGSDGETLFKLLTAMLSAPPQPPQPRGDAQ